MFTSQRKRSRTTLLKSTAKHSENTKQRIDSTGMGMSVRFKEQKNVAEVQEFTQDLPHVPLPATSLPAYTRGELLKDVNYLNSIFNHILVMISSHLATPPDPKNMQLARMSRQIKSLILENVELKGKIDAKYRSMTDLQELAQHLGTSPNELKGARLEEFFQQFQYKQMEAQRLSRQLEQLQRNASPSKHGFPSNEKIQEKEKRCKALRKAIERENQRIFKLQQQQKGLLKKLYETQRQIVKNEHSSSAIKLKLNQAQSEKRLRARTKQGKEGKPEGKQNLPSDNKSKQRKSVRVEHSARLKLLPPRHL